MLIRVSFGVKVIRVWGLYIYMGKTLEPLELTSDQLIGVQFLIDRPRCLLADDVGAGKSAQLLTAVSILGLKRVLWVTSVQAAYQLPGEVALWAPEFTCKVLDGNRSQRQSVYVRPAAINVVGYESFRSDIAFVSARPWDLIILDDAGKFKNADSQVSKAAHLVCSTAPRAWAVTATPEEITLVDTWSIFHAINFYPLGDWPTFNTDFCNWGIRETSIGPIREIVSYRNLDVLSAKLAPYLLRRERTGGPTVHTLQHRVDLLPRQLALYQHARNETSGRFSARSVYTTFTSCLQLCDSTAFVERNPDQWESSKVDLILGLLAHYQEEQFVAYSMWRQTAFHLAEVLRRHGIGFVIMTGLDEKYIRFERQQKFRSDPSLQVCIVTRCAEQALNLQSARFMVCINRLANPQRMHQVEGRITRMGSPHKEVTIVHLVARNTIEERMMALMNRRQELFDQVFGPLTSRGSVHAADLQLLLRQDMQNSVIPEIGENLPQEYVDV